MKRRVLFVLALLICLTRLTPQYLPDPAFNCSWGESALTSRVKQPFPFEAKPLLKKRLASPPIIEQNVAFSGFPDQSPAPDAGLSALDTWLLYPLPCESNRALFPLSLVDWHSCAIEHNVFHPPPAT